MKKLYLYIALPTLLLATPNAPINLNFKDVTSTSVTLTWQDTSHSETGYKIFRDNLQITTVGKNITSFQDRGLTPNHKYTYTVKATDDQPDRVAVNSIKDAFGTNDEPLRFHLSNLAGGDKDWLGIFPIGATLKRDNLLGWTYTHGLKNGDITINTIYPNQGHLSSGSYQIVAFYNDSYIPEAVSYFDVTDKLTVYTTKDIYRTDEHDIVVNLSNAPTKENNKDWLGIFKKGSPNENNSVYSWKYTNDTQSINGNGQPYGTVTLDNNLPEGNYEVRFFADDTYTLLTKSSFKVSNSEAPADTYGQRGDYKVIHQDSENYKIYSPENINNAPVVIFLPGFGVQIDKYTAIMDFIASKGYYVIGFDHSYYSHNNVLSRLDEAKNNHLADTSKISIVGHSYGGSNTFNYLKFFKEKKYGLNKNSIVELDGWFAWNMTPTNMQNLDTISLIIQYGDADGLGEYQDPKINLGVYYMLKDDEKALLHIHANNTHSYQNGAIGDDSFLDKQDLLRPLDAFLDYTLKGNESAKVIAMQDKYQDVKDFINSVNYNEDVYEFACKHKDLPKQYNYCNLNSIISDGETLKR